MKAKNVIWKVLFAVFIILNIILIKSSFENRYVIFEMQTTNELLKDQASLIKKNLFHLIRNRNTKIDTEITVTNQLGENVKLAQLLNKKQNMILRIPEFSCSSCYEKVFQNFSKIDSLYKEDEIIILTTYNNVNTLSNFKRVNQITCSCYNLKNTQLLPDSKIEEMQKPFFLELSDKGDVKSLLIVDKNNFSLLLEYLNILHR